MPEIWQRLQLWLRYGKPHMIIVMCPPETEGSAAQREIDNAAEEIQRLVGEGAFRVLAVQSWEQHPAVLPTAERLAHALQARPQVSEHIYERIIYLLKVIRLNGDQIVIVATTAHLRELFDWPEDAEVSPATPFRLDVRRSRRGGFWYQLVPPA